MSWCILIILGSSSSLNLRIKLGWKILLNYNTIQTFLALQESDLSISSILRYFSLSTSLLELSCFWVLLSGLVRLPGLPDMIFSEGQKAACICNWCCTILRDICRMRVQKIQHLACTAALKHESSIFTIATDNFISWYSFWYIENERSYNIKDG